ncbi:serine-rich adhesin for platelets-like isoform X2 [Panonychus citri]|uniref:serine-rich adhesin for platelets-like isoform X2 n=1 Tax=Panonychus citri TaxID=50023 RepID=UPI00230799BD|nr:serine-rich adhesin for platelets-like isoform X2 [Panonychus citri]
MLSSILFNLIVLINLADYGGPVAIYLPQSKVLPVFIPIKHEHGNDNKQGPNHSISETDQSMNKVRSPMGEDVKTMNEPSPSSDSSDENDEDLTGRMVNGNIMTGKETKPLEGSENSSKNNDNINGNDVDNGNKNVDQSIGINIEQQKTTLLTSSSHQASTINQISNSAMNQLLLNSLGSSLNEDTSSLRINPFGDTQSGQHVFNNENVNDDNNNSNSNGDDDDGDEKAKALEKLIAEADDKRSQSELLSSSLSSTGETFSSLPGSMEGDVGLSSSLASSSESSPSSGSLTPFSGVISEDNINSLQLNSLMSSMKPFQSMSSSSPTSSSTHVRGSPQTLSGVQKFQSLFNSHPYFNLGDTSLTSLNSPSKSNLSPLTLTSDLTGSLQQALSASLPTSSQSLSSSLSSLSSPSSSSSSSSSSSFLPGLSGTSSSSPSDFINMLSLFQQLNDNTMSTVKDDLNLQLLKPLYNNGNSYSPPLTLSSSSSSSPTSSSSSSSSTSPSGSSIGSLLSSNGHKTRTLILPILGDSLFQSANPFYDAFLQSLSASSSPSSSSNLQAGSSLKLFQDGLTSNGELNLDGTTNGQPSIADLSSLSGLTGNNEMDDQSIFTQGGSLVGTSSMGKGHPYVVVDEEFNANGISLPQGYKPDMIGILAGPPCVDTSSHGDKSDKNGKSDKERIENQNDKKPTCPYHHHHHHHNHKNENRNQDRDQDRDSNRDRDRDRDRDRNSDQERDRDRDRDREQDRDRSQVSPPDRYPDQNDEDSGKNENSNQSPRSHSHHHHHHNHPHHSHEPHESHGTNSHQSEPDNHRSPPNDDKDKYHRHHHNHNHHNDEDKPMYTPRNRTAFRSVPLIKGAYRYKPDPGYEGS